MNTSICRRHAEGEGIMKDALIQVVVMLGSLPGAVIWLHGFFDIARSL